MYANKRGGGGGRGSRGAAGPPTRNPSTTANQQQQPALPPTPGMDFPSADYGYGYRQDVVDPSAAAAYGGQEAYQQAFYAGFYAAQAHTSAAYPAADPTPPAASAVQQYAAAGGGADYGYGYGGDYDTAQHQAYYAAYGASYGQASTYQHDSAAAGYGPGPTRNTLNNPAYFCAVCRVQCTGQQNYQDHLGGKKHQEKEGGRGGGGPQRQQQNYAASTQPAADYYCAACNVACTCQQDLQAHYMGRKHQERAGSAGGYGGYQQTDDYTTTTSSSSNWYGYGGDQQQQNAAVPAQSSSAPQPLNYTGAALTYYEGYQQQSNPTYQHVQQMPMYQQQQIPRGAPRGGGWRGGAGGGRGNRGGGAGRGRGRGAAAAGGGSRGRGWGGGAAGTSSSRGAPAAEDNVNPNAIPLGSAGGGGRAFAQSYAAMHNKQPLQQQAADGNNGGAGVSSNYYCAVCDIQCTGEQNMMAHKAGRKHRDLVQAAEIATEHEEGMEDIGGGGASAENGINFYEESYEYDSFSEVAANGAAADENGGGGGGSGPRRNSREENDFVEMLYDGSFDDYDNYYDSYEGGGYSARERQEAKSRSFFCDMCSVNCTGEQSWQAHLVGKAHKKRETAAQEGRDAPQNKNKAAFHCKVCNVGCNAEDIFQAHINGQKHQKAILVLLKQNKPIPSTEFAVIPPRLPPGERSAEAEAISQKQQDLNSRLGILPPYVINDQYMRQKAQLVELSEDELCELEQFVLRVEDTLFAVSEFIEAERDTGGDAPSRLLRGIMRTGLLPNQLLLKMDKRCDLVILCSVIPTTGMLFQILELMATVINKNPENPFCHVTDKIGESAICISQIGIPVDVYVTLTCSAMHQWSPGDLDFYPYNEPPNALPKEPCVEALAEMRRTKFYQVRCEPYESMNCTVKIIREFRRRVTAWEGLTDWIVILIVEKALGAQKNFAIGPSNALRAVFDAISVGTILGSATMVDPCEKLPTDAIEKITEKQRELLYNSARYAIRQITTNKMEKLLALDGSPGIPSSTFGSKRKKSAAHAEQAAAAVAQAEAGGGKKSRIGEEDDDGVGQNSADGTTISHQTTEAVADSDPVADITGEILNGLVERVVAANGGEAGTAPSAVEQQEQEQQQQSVVVQQAAAEGEEAVPEPFAKQQQSVVVQQAAAEGEEAVPEPFANAPPQQQELEEVEVIDID